MTKLKFIQLFFFLLLLFVVLTSSELGRATDDNIGNTGAPLEPQVCANCHNSGASFGTVTITIEIFYDGTTTPVPAYSPGTLYDMRVTVNNSAGSPAGHGFQMTCLKFPSNQPLAGYSALGSNCQQITLTTGTWAGRTYVEQNTMSVSDQFNFSWTAPAAGTGTVKFYAAGNAVNGNNSSSGDKSGNTNITLPELLPLIISNSVVNNVTCFGSNNGAINLTTAGGISPYTFLWNDGVTTEDRTELPQGDYTITITDALGTAITQEFLITEPAQLEANLQVVNPIFPDENGIVDFEIAGGTPPYEVNVDGVGTFSIFPFELPDGNYNYTVLDANNCELDGSLEVLVPPSLAVIAEVHDVSCNGFADGSIALQISGATPPYDIQWSSDSEGESISDLAAGEYQAVITDAVGYIAIMEFSIDEPDALEGSATSSPISCFGGTTEVVVAATGGILPYSGTGVFVREAGIYFFEIADANGCSTQAEITITEPELLSATASSAAIFCVNDSADIEVAALGGTLPYSGTGIFTITTPGQFPFTVTDSNGCTSTVLAEVLAIDGPSIQTNVNAPSCYNACNGEVQLSFENVIAPYSVIWNDGSTDENRENLCAGIYNVSLIESTGCTVNNTILLSAPDSIQLTFDVPSIFCFGDTVTTQVDAIGGTPPYTFLWPDGTQSQFYNTTAGNYNVQVADGNDCTSSGNLLVTQPDSVALSSFVLQPLCHGDETGSIDISISGGTLPFEIIWQETILSEDLSGLPEGQYTVEITDGGGCFSSGTFEINWPDELSLVVENFTTTENGTASVNVTASGGTPPYNFMWSDGQTVEDVQLQTGNWILTVTDENGCTVSSELFNVPQYVHENQLPELTVYPNPAFEILEVKSTMNHFEINLHDVFGTAVFSGTASNGKLLIDVGKLAPGMYSLSLISGSSTVTEKIVLIGR